MNNLVQLLISAGLTKEEAEAQLQELGQLIAESVTIRLAEDAGKTNVSAEEFSQLIEISKNNQRLQKIIEEESSRLTNEYLTTVTDGLPEEEKQQLAVELIRITGLQLA